MKVRNKKTGEVKEALKVLDMKAGDYYIYDSLAKIYEEWEDYEPKEFYFIDQFMSVSKGVVDDVEYAGRHNAVNYAKKTSNNLKTAGNYFSTKEEAEKAVEKLKAWKRLKDKGFKFLRYQPVGEYGSVSFHLNHRLNHRLTSEEKQDLDLLFEGEEWPKS